MNCRKHNHEGEDFCPYCEIDVLRDVLDDYRQKDMVYKKYQKGLQHHDNCNSMKGIVRHLSGQPIILDCNCGLHQILGVKINEPME